MNNYDPSWINFEYLEAYRVKINFKRDNDWKTSLPLNELSYLEEDLFYDKHLTWQEKSVILKETVNNNLPEPLCKFCKKNSKMLENVCLITKLFAFLIL